jgi:addiction module RelE/StbE family toxin
MTVNYSKQFLKNYKARIAPNPSLTHKFEERVKLFLLNPNSPLLKNHSLKGSKKRLCSFSITGDIRTIYIIEKDVVFFLDVGSHNQVY